MPLSQEDRDAIDPQGAIERQAVETATMVADELTDLNPNIEIDAKEFGEHVRNGGWRLGLLVGRSVSLREGQTSGLNNVGDLSPTRKISSRSFARQAGNISKDTVTKYLNAWNLAAADGHVPASSTLSPGQEVDFTGTNDDGDLILNPKLWDKYFKTPSGGNEKTVDSAVIDPINRLVDLALRDWICSDQYDGTDNNINTAYKAFQSLIRKGYEGIALCEEVATSLNMEIKDEGN